MRVGPPSYLQCFVGPGSEALLCPGAGTRGSWPRGSPRQPLQPPVERGDMGCSAVTTGELLKEPTFPQPVLVLLKLGPALLGGLRAPAWPESAEAGSPHSHQGPRGPARSSGAGRNQRSSCVQVLGASHSPALNEDRSPIEWLEEVTCGHSTYSQVTSAAPPVPVHAPVSSGRLTAVPGRARTCQGTEPAGGPDLRTEPEPGTPTNAPH